MGLLPFARRVIVLRRGNVGAVVHPAVPARRDGRGLGVTVVDHPAARNAKGRVRPLVIDIAELVLADLLAEAPGKEAGADGLSIPPGEYLREEIFHMFFVCFYRRSGQRDRGHPTASETC